jgi:hypothetical protein
MPQIFVKIKRHLYCVAPHFEIWAASQISEVMDFYRVRDAMLEIPANHRVGPSKAEIVTCSTSYGENFVKAVLSTWCSADGWRVDPRPGLLFDAERCSTSPHIRFGRLRP